MVATWRIRGDARPAESVRIDAITLEVIRPNAPKVSCGRRKEAATIDGLPLTLQTHHPTARSMAPTVSFTVTLDAGAT
jgi:hypothetical protein